MQDDQDEEKLGPPTTQLKFKEPESSMRLPAPRSRPRRTWNTKNLGLRLGSDAVAASAAAALVAPLVAIIDRAIMENASGRRTLSQCFRSSFRQLLLRPHTFFFSKPFALIFMVYQGTYLSANAVDTASSTFQNRPATHVTTGMAKFTASSASNTGICLYKDQVFVRMFGPSGLPPRTVPWPSYALFTLRDALTIFASFNVPPLLGPVLTDHMSAELQKHMSGQTVAQFAAPAMVQLVSTPIHLLGLDMYNRQGLTWADRFAIVRRNWAPSVAARICRIVPAFGFGGVVNAKTRRALMEKLL